MRLEAQGCGMDSRDKVKKSRLYFFSVDRVLRMLFMEPYPFSLNQVGADSLRYLGNRSSLFFIAVFWCERYVRFLLISCICLWCQGLSGTTEFKKQKTKPTPNEKNLGLYKKSRVLHNKVSKVKTEVSIWHLAFLERHRFFCIGIQLTNIHCSIVLRFLVWIRSIHVPHAYYKATGEGSFFIYFSYY